MAKSKNIQSGENQITHVVEKPFRDKGNFSIRYEKGDDVSHFDKDRLKKLSDAGIVKSSLNQ